MIDEIEKMKHLHKVQMYIANALLKYEGLGLSNKTIAAGEEPNPES
jgi:hypothetical protein